MKKEIAKLAHLIARYYAKNVTKNKTIYLSPIPKETPFILLGNHSCFFDFIFAYQGIGPVPIHFVVAEKYFHYPIIGQALRYVGAIPKKLAIRDLDCIRSLINTVNSGCSIAIYPEGRVSMWGVTEHFSESTASLVKKLKIPLVLVQDRGGFFMAPPYGGKGKRMKTKTVIKCLTKEEIETLSVAEIDKEIRQHLSVNQYDYIEKEDLTKYPPLSEKVIHLLYRCPHCHELDSLTLKKSFIKCGRCDCTGKIQNQQIKWNKEGIPTSISELYYHYIKLERDIFFKEEQITYNVKIKVKSLKTNKVTKEEQGKVLLTEESLQIESLGMKEIIKLATVDYIPFDCGKNFQIYTKDNYIEVIPKEKYVSTAIAVKVEMLKAEKSF